MKVVTTLVVGILLLVFVVLTLGRSVLSLRAGHGPRDESGYPRDAFYGPPPSGGVAAGESGNTRGECDEPAPASASTIEEQIEGR